MSGKSATPNKHHSGEIDSILRGDVNTYARWAFMRMQGLERNREYLKKQVTVAEQRCAAIERMLKPAMESEAELR
eukprot:791567-Prymnesium_polylepis.1